MQSNSAAGVKVSWSGVVVSVQPRIRLTRSFDQSWHNYLGYQLIVDGTCGEECGNFSVAVGKAAHGKLAFRIGMWASGKGMIVPDPRLETASVYKVSGIKAEPRPASGATTPPPYQDLAPPLEVYRARGHRRLNKRTYDTKCAACMWGCNMAVELIIDQWNPSNKRYRTETFCYGPKSCPLYSAGPCREVPGRHGMKYVEEDWVDEDATSHRGPDE